jgi:hypothetical protein
MRLGVNLAPDAIPGPNSTVAISPAGARIVFPIRGPDGKPLLATRLLDQAAITPRGSRLDFASSLERPAENRPDLT